MGVQLAGREEWRVAQWQSAAQGRLVVGWSGQARLHWPWRGLCGR